jgi:hypothetical protein
MKTFFLVALTLFIGYIASVAEVNPFFAGIMFMLVVGSFLWLVWAAVSRVFSWLGRLCRRKPAPVRKDDLPSLYGSFSDKFSVKTKKKKDLEDFSSMVKKL